jgi:hypothetical protein
MAARPTVLLMQLGYNDWGLTKWSGVAFFQAALASFMDQFHSALPGCAVYLLTEYPITTEGTTNGNGETVSQYRTAASNVQSTRPWISLLNGFTIPNFSTSTMLVTSGNPHLNDIGQSFVATWLQTQITVPPSTNPTLFCASNTPCVQGELAANNGEMSLIYKDGADVVHVGDPSFTTTTEVQAATNAQILVSNNAVEVQSGLATAIVSGGYSWYATSNGIQFFGSTVTFGSGTGVIGITNATTLPTTVPSATNGLALGGSTDGWHAYEAGAQFTDYVILPLNPSTANSQAAQYHYAQSCFSRTTSSSSVSCGSSYVIASGHAAKVNASCTGRAVTNCASGCVIGDFIGVDYKTSFSNVGGTVTQAGTPISQTTGAASMASTAVTFSISSNNLTLKTSGTSSTSTIDWTCDEIWTVD